jgi:hypothetical protein
MELAMIVPSRGRPHNIVEVIDSFSQTRSRGTTKLIIGVDNDDPKLYEYEMIERDAPGFVKFEYGPRLRMGGTLNKLAVKYAKKNHLIGFMGDDHRPRTHSWDQRFVEATQDSTAVMYGNDLIQGPNLPTAVVMTSDIINTIGYMVPPTMVHLFLDNFWLTLGRKLNRLYYVPEIIIEHVHPISGKVGWDQGYVEVNSGEQWNADEKAWNEYQANDLARDIHAITLTW